MTKILVTGPQGSGKTTHSKLLSERLQIPLIDTGNMLRNLAETNTSDGRRIKEQLDKGNLAPDDIVGKIVQARVSQEDCKSGFVMDGYPRSLEQLQVFDPGYDHVFYLDISDREVTQRLLERGRVDDTTELIARRLDLYHERTEPVLDYYQDLDILTRVNGSGSIEEVEKRIQEAL